MLRFRRLFRHRSLLLPNVARSWTPIRPGRKRNQPLAPEERPQVAHVLEGVEGIHTFDERLGSRPTEHWGHQAARLGVDALGIERILLCPRWIPREMADLASVAQGHLHQAAPWRLRIHQAAIGDQLYPLPHRADPRIVHPLV